MANPGIISLDLRTLTVNEEVGQAIIPVVRTEGSDGTVSVDYSVNNGTATAGDDFTASSGTLTFTEGQTSKEIVVPIIDDTIPETDETFNIAIGNAVGTVLGDIRTANVTIEDNDALNQEALFFSQEEYNFGENQGEAIITVIRGGNRNDTVFVDYSTGNDYARAGSDYTAVSGTLTFAPSEMSKTFTVPLQDDRVPEFNESLKLILNNPVGTDLGIQNTARLIIDDDDELPFIFKQEILISGLASGKRGEFPPGPTAFDWTPDGKLLIAKLDGIVRLFDNGELLQEPFIDISEQVNIGGQRGLLGLAVHPEFPEKPYVYLGFSYDPPGVEPDLDTQTDPNRVGRVTRLIRVTADPNSNYTTAVPGSEVILLETLPVANFHAAGAIRFGNDGSLFFSHGDGTQVNSSPIPEGAEILQSLDNPFGKLFRINPITGEGYSDNPFFDGDPNSIRSKVYNYGLRNPWRYAIHPETGEPFIGDVGWTNWEEINTGRGVNFGWPLYEGGNGVTLRTEAIAEAPEFQELYDSSSEVAPSIYAINHRDGFRAITMGDFYTGTTYPDLYQGALFFSDFGPGGQVNALLFDDQGNVDSAIPFIEQNDISQISMGPDSNLYFSTFRTGQIGRWVFEREVSLLPNALDLEENSNTANRIKLADIVISDDALGTNNISLSGADADNFEVDGSELFLKADINLDFETKNSYVVTVEVNDPEVGNTPDVTTDFTLNVTDVNESPTVALQSSVSNLPEDSNTTNRIKIADIAISDDALGTNNISLSGADADNFEVDGSELFLRAGTNLDFETKNSYGLTVEVNDPDVGNNSDATANLILNVTDINEPPTDIALVNPINNIAQNTDTTNRIKIADIAITDDALGTNNIELNGGADADSFEVEGRELFLKAGTNIDFEAKDSFTVTITIDDPDVGTTPDLTEDFTLNFTDVNEPPTDVVLVILQNQIAIIAENSNTASPIKVADIGISTNNISLSGADASSFEVEGGELFLKAGTNLDFETKNSYSVTVEADELGLIEEYTLNVSDVPELDDPLIRFHNDDRPGSYLFAGQEESESIRQNFPNFREEGDAFNVSSLAENDLIPFYRFRHSEGGYLFADEAESSIIRENFPNFMDEGIAFYALGADAGEGVDIFRFRNTELLGSYIFVTEAEKNSIEANYPNFIPEGVAFEAIV